MVAREAADEGPRAALGRGVREEAHDDTALYRAVGAAAHVPRAGTPLDRGDVRVLFAFLNQLRKCLLDKRWNLPGPCFGQGLLTVRR